MKCPKCNAEASGAGRFCRSCGAPLTTEREAAPDSSVCPACGAAVRPGSKFCAACAAPIGSVAQVEPPPAGAIAICGNCGAQSKAGTKFCQSCGKPLGATAPAATPDMMPTAVIATPPRPAPPPARPPQPAAMAEPLRPAVPVPAPQVVPARSPAAQKPQPQGGSNRGPLIAGVAVLALVALAATYWFVLRKPAAQNVVAVQPPAAAQPPASAPADASTAPATESQTPAATEAQPPAEATDPATSPAGNSQGSPAAPPAQKRAPAKPAPAGYAQAHKNAEQALAASQYLSPPDSSALFWARKAKALGDPGAAQIEQEIFAKQLADVTASKQGHNYDQARAQLYLLASNFPDHTELRQLQDDIRQEQQQYTQQQEDQRRQAEKATQVKKIAVQHRHGVGSNFCTGIITVNPDGTARYDCTTADGGGRCEHVVFATGSLKEAKMRGDGSLHVATRQSGNFDFVGGDMNLKDAAAALAPLVSH